MIRQRGQILKLLLLVSSTYSAGVILYAYAGGDPVNKWDPTGLAAYFFDGTGNHPLAANLDGSANFKTNVRYLFDAYIGDAFYAYGIGTGYDPAGGVHLPKALVLSARILSSRLAARCMSESIG